MFLRKPAWLGWDECHVVLVFLRKPARCHDYSAISSSCHDSNSQLFMSIPPLPPPVMIPTHNFSCLFRLFLSQSWFQPSAFHVYSAISSPCHDSKHQLFILSHNSPSLSWLQLPTSTLNKKFSHYLAFINI